jgi:hypothetical protein
MPEPRDPILGRVALLVFAVGLLSMRGHAQYAGGSGTAQDPYQLATAADLIALGDSPQDYDKYFILTADIDLDPNLPDGRVFDRAVIAPYGNPVPYDRQAVMFSGVFDGQGRRIVNLAVSGGGYLGFFGCLGQSGVVLNLGLEQVNIVGTDDRAGGLVASNGGTIANSYSTGAAQGPRYLGGLVGENRGVISNCCSTVALRGTETVGGLVGENRGVIANSYSVGVVTAGHSAGGLLGQNYSGAVSNCFWDKTASKRTGSAGGTGLTTVQMRQRNSFVGWGFVGEQEAAACAMWQMPEDGGYPVLSVFRGYLPPEPNGDGSPAHPYLIATAADLATLAYRPAACYQLAADIDLSSVTWSMAVVPAFAGRFEGRGYRLVGLTVSGGGALGLFGCLAPGAVVSDLTLDGANVVGTGNWVGALAGSNWGTVSGCRSSGTVGGTGWSVGGLVGENNGALTDCHTAAAVSGTGWSMGGLVGSNWGTLASCSSAGAVSGIQNIGGLVGENRGAISTSCGTGPVTGFGFAGGLVGCNWGALANTYSTAAVGGNDALGGLVGWNTFDATIANSYSAGAVTGFASAGGLTGDNDGTVSNCFWDRDASGRATSAAGTGKPTAELQTAGTFLRAGWDFVGETINGAEDPWWIDEGQTYPRLTWEATP